MAGVSHEAGPAPSGTRGRGLSTYGPGAPSGGGSGLSGSSTSGHAGGSASHKGQGVSVKLPAGRPSRSGGGISAKAARAASASKSQRGK